MRLFESGKVVAFVVLVWLIGSFLIFQAGPVSKLMSWPDGIFFDMEPEFTNEQALAGIRAMGDEGKKLYQTHFSTDLVYIFLQTLGIAALFWYATSKFSWTRRWFRVFLIPVLVIGGLDIAENFAIQSALNDFPDTTANQFDNVRRLVGLKMSSLIAIPATLLLSIGLVAAHKFQNRNGKTESSHAQAMEISD